MKAAPPFAEAAIAEDCTAVMDASSALDVREVDFFRLSYRQWFGRDAREPDLERAFAAYMFRQFVPPWVRHFSRKVLQQAERGRLDPATFGALPFRRQPPPPPNGRVHVGMAVAVMVFYFAALLNISYDPETSAPLPCQGGPGLKIIADLAHAIGGRDPIACAAWPRPR